MIQNTSAMDRPVAPARASGRRWIYLLAAALLVAAVSAWFYPDVRGWLAAERSFDFERLRTAKVTRGELLRDLAVQGRIIAAFHPTTSSPAAGIVSLHVRAGDVVEKGAVLAVVDSPELLSRLNQEKSTLSALESAHQRQVIASRQSMLAERQKVDQSRVEFEAAQRSMARAERSRKAGILNDVEYEKAQDELHSAELKNKHAQENAALQKETLEFEVEDSKLQVERQQLVVADLMRQVAELSVRSPVSGLVSRLDVDDHDSVTPGQALVGVVDLSAFEIEMMIPESYADEIGPGIQAVINYQGNEYSGAVRSVSPEVEGNQVRGVVAFAGETPEGLRQNQRVSTRLVIESRPDVLKVARGPFLEAGGGRQAYLIEGDIARLTDIRTGATSINEVEITSGLNVGDRIIVSDTARFEGAERIFLRR